MSATKKYCMAACFALLCLIMASVVLRYFTTEVLVKRMHMDNGVTRLVLFDQAGLRDQGKPKPKPKPPNPATQWSKLYPFKEAKQAPAKKTPAKKAPPSPAQKLVMEIKNKSQKIRAKKNAVEKDIMGRLSRPRF